MSSRIVVVASSVIPYVTGVVMAAWPERMMPEPATVVSPTLLVLASPGPRQARASALIVPVVLQAIRMSPLSLVFADDACANSSIRYEPGNRSTFRSASFPSVVVEDFVDRPLL